MTRLEEIELEVASVSVRFGERVAVDQVDLALRRGSVTAVLGPSGCGKSSLLRAIAGLEPLASGAIRRRGEDLAGVAPHRRGIGMMFQQPALFPHRDVAGNVGFGLVQRGERGAALRHSVDRLLELVGLPGAGSRRVDELSGGEQQRVALARALAPAPAILLLDEPMGALDRALRERLVRDLGELIAALGLTVLAVTHDRAEAFALADEIVVMDAGAVRQHGPPPVVWGTPVDRRVAELLGLGNLVEVAVEDGTAHTPWGPVVLPGRSGPATLLVRPDGVRLTEAGPMAAEVVATTFQGATTWLDLAVAGQPTLRVEVATDQAPRRGATVRFLLEPAGVVRLADPAPG